MNTDRMQTVMGIGEASLVGVMDYFMHLEPDGLNWTSPTFWLGLVLAASRAVKGYYAAGVKA
jgi:hypothetical protein